MGRYAQRSLCCSRIFNLLSSSLTAPRLHQISSTEWLGIEEITLHTTNVCAMNAWKVSVAAPWPCDQSLFICVSWHGGRATVKAVNPFHCTAITVWNSTILHHVDLHHASVSCPLPCLSYSQVNSTPYKLISGRCLVTVSKQMNYFCSFVYYEAHSVFGS